MSRREPVPKVHARKLVTTLTFDQRDEIEVECLRFIRKAPHGEMTKRLMDLVLDGYKGRRARPSGDNSDA